MTSVAIYARQSEDVSEGVERQLARCRALVASRGWGVAREYVDNDTSASKERRNGTAWAEMLVDLERKTADVVVAVDIDRLLRSTRDLVRITETGARVLTVDGEIDLTTADGEFRATMLTGIARFEVRRKSERQRRANDDRASRGKPLPGRRRYGYETDGITPRDAEAEVVRRMFRHVSEGGSIRGLTLALNAEGVDPGPGKGTAWRTGRVRDILNNPHYGGAVRHHGTITESDVIRPIVPAELAAEVRALLADPSRRTTPGGTVRHLLSGIARCGVCGAAMVYRRGYTCSVLTHHPQITKPRLEGRIRDELAKALLSGGEGLFEDVAPIGVAPLVEAHERNLAAVTAAIADRDEGLVPPALTRTRLIELKEAREAIEKELDRARTERSASSALADLARDLLGEVSEWSMSDYDEMKSAVLARFDTLDLDRQRETVRALLYVEVHPGRDPRRVHVEHLRASHLNEDADDPQHAFD